MFMVSRISDVIRIPPDRMGEPLEKVSRDILNEKYAGLYDRDLGIIIGAFDLEIDPIGRMIHNDAGTYHNAEMSVLSFKPMLQEVVEAPVIDIKDFGIFVRLGPVDGFIHKSQISDEYVEYDPTRPCFILRDSNRLIEIGDMVRARIVALSFSPERREVRIQLTMRQPYLGKIPRKR
jgi:DNA-directed RNA polymerase subunit E'